MKSTNYKKYHSKNILKRLMLNRFKKKILNYLKEETKKTTLLDAGCGEGFISDFIYNNTNIKNITGIDINTNTLNLAKKINNKINYIKNDIYKINYKEDTFDIVICLEVLEHLKDPTKALNNLIKITKKKIIISVPNEPFFSLGNLISLKNIKTLGNPKDHINKWSTKQFVNFLKENNLNNIEINNSFPWTVAIIYFNK